YLSVLHRSLGIDSEKASLASTETTANNGMKVNPNSALSNQNFQEPPISSNLNGPNSAVPRFIAKPADLLITSTPSGAEIYLDGVNTERVTPSKIQVPGNEKFSISLRRSGYIEYQRQDLLKSEVGIKLSATLQKALVGYLNIDVIPPRAAKVYINGQRLSGELLPIFNYAVPAETWITVRAEEPIGSLYAEEKVLVSRDQKKNVRLYLKKRGKSRR
ncbi:MAG: PEGA domain-containing protein, partial [Bdellovibrionales bacterium]|nr:PEGA domain-containing protein [Bdellovibrionales bacterium]